MTDSYKQAAELVAQGDSAALSKVPSVAEVDSVMSGRRQAAFLETHHTVPQEWARRLIPGITDEELDQMPAFILDRAQHRATGELPDI